METDIFADTAFGKVALQKMQPVPENFRLFEFCWLEDRPENWETMEVKGAVFRKAKSGPNKGKLSILVKGTERTVYITRDQIRQYQNDELGDAADE